MAELTNNQVLKLYALFKELDPDQIPSKDTWAVIKNRLQNIIDHPEDTSPLLPSLELSHYNLPDDGSSDSRQYVGSITKPQLIQIAKAGFPPRVKQFIDFENLEMHHLSGVFRLYKAGTDFVGLLPDSNEVYLSVIVGEDDFIQFVPPRSLAFNDFAAIREMERLGLITA